jgi:TRAP-type C4-dicarboxylate transport system substrate-binding protein
MPRRFKTFVCMGAAVAVLFVSGARVTTIKLATLAPNGSTWMNIMQEMVKELQDRSEGQIRLRIYPGGVLGDEKDMVRRMRIGQLHSGAMTSVGLSLIQKESLVFQLPLMFENYEELDHARDNLLPEMEAAFEQNGFVFLGWGDVGPVYIFSKDPIRSRADLKRAKIWGWVDDRIAMALFKEAGITPIPLSVSEVLPSLQTGVVNAAPSTPLACVALQWFSTVKYMTDLPLSISIGATVLTKKQFERLDANGQTLLREVSGRYHRKLNQEIRKDNDEALETLKQNGIQMVPIAEQDVAEWEAIALRVRQKLTGELYSQEILNKVIRLVKDYRENITK